MRVPWYAQLFSFGVSFFVSRSLLLKEEYLEERGHLKSINVCFIKLLFDLFSTVTAFFITFFRFSCVDVFVGSLYFPKKTSIMVFD